MRPRPVRPVTTYLIVSPRRKPTDQTGQLVFAMTKPAESMAGMSTVLYLGIGDQKRPRVLTERLYKQVLAETAIRTLSSAAYLSGQLAPSDRVMICSELV